MLRTLKTLLLTAFLALFATQAPAMFIQPDWYGVSEPGVGTNRYAYSGNDPVNKMDPSGHAAATPEELERADAEQEDREAKQSDVRLAGKAKSLADVLKGIVDAAKKAKAKKQLAYARRRAVADAWKMERQAASNGYPTTRQWTPDELQELITTGRVRGYVGDHINSVNGNIEMAARHQNIQFSTTAEHAARHKAAGGYRAPVSGQELDRTYGELPDLATPYARGWPDRAKELGLLGLTGVASGLDFLDRLDPTSPIIDNWFNPSCRGPLCS